VIRRLSSLLAVLFLSFCIHSGAGQKPKQDYHLVFHVLASTSNGEITGVLDV
jgi:hypothetical protein